MTKLINTSFEFFPPKDMAGAFGLYEAIQELKEINPKFISVTYGAGGTTRELTHDAVRLIHKKFGLNVAAHLTCVNATQAETLEIAHSYAEVGVNEIVALRGDPPKGAGKFTPYPEGFENSLELISALSATGKFKIRVGAYPDPHPEAQNSNSDLFWLKRKFEAGAHSAISQFFFDTETYFRFRDRADKEGISGKIIPGILPIVSLNGLKNFAKTCGLNVPQKIIDRFEETDQSPQEISIDIATQTCQELIDNGVEDLHFYTLNRPLLTKEVCKNIGLAPKTIKQTDAAA